MKPRIKELGDKNIVGTKVKELRISRRLKQNDLLAKLHIEGICISSTGLSQLEGQHRSATDKEIVALAKIFNVSYEDLLGSLR